MAATIRFSPEEDEILEAYCRQHQRTKNDVVRELVRSLRQQPSYSLTTVSISSRADQYSSSPSKNLVDDAGDGETEGQMIGLNPYPQWNYQPPQPNHSLDLSQMMNEHEAKEAQLLAVGDGVYELYFDGRFVSYGTYKEIMRHIRE